MRLLAVALFTILGASASPAAPDMPAAKSEETAALAPSGGAGWSVAGRWDCKHRDDWTDTLTIRPDGTFSRGQGDAGRWTLAGLQDHVILVLAWDHWPAGTVTMVGLDEFRCDVAGYEIVMHRIKPAAPRVETRTWRQGEPPVRLIREEEGFCALSLVTGHFEGGGEVVKVYVGEDGYWYLGGQSGQEGVAAQCIIVRYGTKP